MNSRHMIHSSSFWTLVGLCFVVGCGPTEDPRITELREQFLQTAPPAAADSIRAVLDRYADTEQQAAEVTIVGRIHGGELDPIDPKLASFALSELPDPGHNHDDPGDCPFCKHKAESAPFAVIQFTDSSGAVIDIPADDLFGLAKNNDVVVTGTSTLVEDMLVVSASRVTIMPDVDSARALLPNGYSVSSTSSQASPGADESHIVELDASMPPE